MLFDTAGFSFTSQSYFGGKVSWMLSAGSTPYAYARLSPISVERCLGCHGHDHTQAQLVSVLFRWKGVLDMYRKIGPDTWVVSQSYFGGKVSWIRIGLRLLDASAVSVLFRWKGVLDAKQFPDMSAAARSQSYFGGKVSWIKDCLFLFVVSKSQSYFGGKVSWMLCKGRAELHAESQSYFGGKVSWIQSGRPRS